MIKFKFSTIIIIAVGLAFSACGNNDGGSNAPDIMAVTGITLNKTATVIFVGDAEQLFPEISPSNAANQNVIWESGNHLVAEVNEEGFVTGVTEGNTTVTVTTEDGGFTASCAVTVSAIKLTAVSLDEQSISLNSGLTRQLFPVFYPPNATNQNVIWESEDRLRAEVNEDGFVTGLMEGNTKVIVTTEDGGFTASCAVNVSVVKVIGVILDKTSITIPRESTEQLTATIIPDNATNQTVVWMSNDESIAKVSAEGIVTGKTQGNTTVKALSKDGGDTADCFVTVTD